MAVSSIAVTDAASPDKYLHTHQRTISSTAREDQYVQQGESAYPTYVVDTGSVSIATSSDHLLQIMADGTNYTRLKRFRIQPTDDIPASASVALVQLFRLSTAGTGGTAKSEAPYDTADNYTGDMRTLPAAKGTESTRLMNVRLALPSSLGASLDYFEWVELPGMKPIIFGTATSAGLAWKIQTGIASCQIEITAEFIVTSYL